MRKLLLLIVLVIAAAAPVQAQGDPDFDPFPAGACVRLTVVDPDPVCVIVDPTR